MFISMYQRFSDKNCMMSQTIVTHTNVIAKTVQWTVFEFTSVSCVFVRMRTTRATVQPVRTPTLPTLIAD